MQIHYDLEKLPSFRNAIVTIGTFDGVHMGHRQVIAHLLDEAKKNDGESVIITFHPHPRKVISSSILGIRLINTLEEKAELLAQLGVDHLVVVPFNEVFANQTAEEYVEEFLVKKFSPHTIIIGYDHRFGRDRQGDYHLLEDKAKSFGYKLLEIPKHILDNISISSTNIREAIVHNDITTANTLLGYDFFFSGKVVGGDKLGRKLGYPTANLKVENEEKILPGIGIYAVYAVLTGAGKPSEEIFTHHHHQKGMMSIGLRPTVGGKKLVTEVNLFDFDRDIYGSELRVFIKKYLREEKKFDSLEELVKQIDQDKMDSLEVL